MSVSAKRYARLKRFLWFTDLVISTSFLITVIATGSHIHLQSWVMQQTRAWPLQVAFYSAILWGGLLLIRFPLDAIRSFEVEHRFGLSNQNFPAWLKEYGKQVLLGSLIGLVLVEGLSFLLRAAPSSWWLLATGCWILWSIFLTWVAPTLLIPLFYKQIPLKDSPVRQRLEKLLDQCRTKVEGIFELNLSTTTTKGNACLCGLGATRRVLVSDTLLNNYPIEEIEMVLAHELGHHHFYHLWILIIVSSSATGLSLFGMDILLRYFSNSLGITTLHDGAALPVIGLFLEGTSLFFMPAINGISRILERQADSFALRQTRNPDAFIATMQRLAQQNLAELNPPAWVEWLLYDHPSISKRIAVAQQYNHQS